MTTKSYNKKIIDKYGADPREIPLYGILQAAQYLNIPSNTLTSWVRGRKYFVSDGEARFFKPIIKLPDRKLPMLSFINLVEAHVLNGMRRFENVPFYKVRRALSYLEKQLPSPHPLADIQFETDGIDLFITHIETLINVSGHGQIAMREIVSSYLRRIDRDLNIGVLRLYPFIRREPSVNEPKKVVIDPLVSFGRPVIVGTGIPTDVIAERFYGGESADDLAKDYDITREQVEEAVRYEGYSRKAA